MNGDPIKLYSVQFSSSEVCELDDGKVLVSIPRDKIRKLSLQRGTSANRPLPQFIIALILIVIGVFCSSPILRFLTDAMSANAGHASITGLQLLAFGVPMILIGIWLIAEIVRKKYYLLIQTEDGSQKIAFESKAELLRINLFIRDVHQEFGYSISSNLDIIMEVNESKGRHLVLVLTSFLILLMTYYLLWISLRPLLFSSLPDTPARAIYLLFSTAMAPLIAGLYLFFATRSVPKIIVKRNMFYAVFAGMVGSWLIYIIRRFFGVGPALPASSIYDLIRIFCIILWAPFVEETLYRGYFLEILKLKWNNIGALLLSSILFTLPHLFNIKIISLNTILLYGFSIFADSIIFGMVYLQGGLIAAFVVHALSNCYEFF